MAGIQPGESFIKETSNHYNLQIKGIDSETRKLLDSIIKQARWATYLNLGIHLVLFIIAGTVLVWSLLIMFKSVTWGLQQQISLGGIIVSLLILLVILLRNPVQLIRQPLISLTSLLFIYTNFTRQIRQTDALFRKSLLNSAEADEGEYSKIYDRMQIALEEGMDQVRNLFDEL